ncbi:hypothetical protein GCM10027341_02010 [Spirosoma knui]
MHIHYQTFAKLLPILLLGLLACDPKSNEDGIIPNPGGPDQELPGTATSIGKPLGAPFTTTIGPAGGTLVTPDGKLSVTFPAGAVSKETQLTVQPVENTAPNGVGTSYHISPDNLTFDKPVSFDYVYQDKEVIGTSVDALAMAFQDDNKVWQLAQPVTVDKPRKRIRFWSKSAKWWGFIAQYRLLPALDTAEVGELRDLKLMRISTPFEWRTYTQKDIDEGKSLNYPKYAISAERPAFEDVRGAYLNGQDWTNGAPKDQTWGSMSFSYSDKRILYIGPNRKPKTQNPVQITIEISNHESSAKLMLISQMYVKGENTLTANGRDFSNALAVQASYAGGTLNLTVIGTDSTGKRAMMSLLVKNPKVSAFAFDLEHTNVSLLNEAAKSMETQAASEYTECNKPKASGGTVNILKFEQSGGSIKLQCRVSGTLVNVHEEDDKCNVKKHVVTSTFAEFSTLVRQ